MKRARVRQTVLVLLAFLFLVQQFTGFAQVVGKRAFGKAAGGKAEASQVHAELLADVAAVHPGEPFHLGVHFKMEAHWHIYWREPGDTGLPTTVEWKLPPGFQAGELQWPAPKKFEEEGSVSYGYDEEVLLFSRITPPANLKSGEALRFGAKADWLVCKVGGQCIPGDAEKEIELRSSAAAGVPAKSPSAGLFEQARLQVPKVVSAPTTTTQSTTSAKPPSDLSPPTSSGPSNAAGLSFIKEAPAAEGISIPLLLLYAFLGGLILNIMPCVLPVLSIKILSFVRQSAEDRGQIFKLGMVFVAGVFASFIALATVVIALQSAGSQVGWGFQFQEPRFVILMTAIVFAFGLSLFGLFEVQLPGSAVQGVEGLQRKEGAAGAFFNGVLATILATPCTAPFLAPALGFAFTQSTAMIYVFFCTIAAGLALPYALLSAQPGWIKFLPKPGGWMETFKQAMGFLLMATVVWLLSTIGGQLGSDGVIWTLAFLTTLGFACWLIGRGFDLRSTRTKRMLTGLIAIGVVGAGYWIFPERYLRGIKAQSEGETLRTPVAGGQIDWQAFSASRVEKLVAENRTVFVDFTADWCLNCKLNEKTALSSAEVEDAFRKHDVVALKADYTKRSPEITTVLQQFGRSGVPLYVIFPAGRAEKPIVLPDGLITASTVVEKLNEAAKEKGIASSRP